MRIVTRCGLLVLGMLMLGACGGAREPDTLHGAWLGTGKFNASRGSLDMKAQLELLADGTYRFLVLEPPIAVITGLEEGTWDVDGETLSLTPVEPESTSESRLGWMGSAPRNYPPKDLTVASGMRRLTLHDGPMQLTFERNPAATKKLREAGDI